VAERTRGMGRGLAAILSVPGGAVEDELRSLPVDAIAPNPYQPRQRFAEEGLTGLAASVRERGVLQPVLVRPTGTGGYELIAGERRWRAAELAGLETIPAIVRDVDSADSLELALIENMAREDLNPVDQARACAALVEELGLTREAIGRRVGRNRVTISNLLRLLDLPDEALARLESGVLTEGHGRAILMAPDHGDRRDLARAAAEHGWSVRQTEARARELAAGAKPKRGLRAVHPDQDQAIQQLADALGGAMGRDVAVRPRRDGYRITIDVESVEDGIELARRFGPDPPR
jgi:ParB family transcriptional regulator, chromosome partitioning protein